LQESLKNKPAKRSNGVSVCRIVGWGAEQKISIKGEEVMAVTLGINISHNCSIAILKDSKVIGYYQEDRFIDGKGYKNFNPTARLFSPLYCIKEKVSHVDHVGISSYDSRGDGIPFFDQLIINKLKRQLNKEEVFFKYEHHLYHAFCGTYFSKFNEGLCLVMDGGGARVLNDYPHYQEIESIYYFDENRNFTCLYKHLSNVRLPFYNDPLLIKPKFFTRDKTDYHLSNTRSSGMKFGRLTRILNLGTGADSGKTMGLAAYGNEHGSRPEDMAKKLQIETRDDTIELIKKAMSYVDTKNIVLSGGYALNCSNNYEYVKAFPQLNFFVDPIAHDGGTAVGVALKVRSLHDNS
jgi:carbamoyltransferase